jgi:DNA-binding NtrC family response regulator
VISLVIIDDNPGSLELLSTALAQGGLEILCASDPEEGLDLVFDRHPQIVITDLVMPKMSGMEILEKIVDFDPAIEVILITAHYSTESAVEAIQKGAADYLNKPVSIDGLRNRIAKLLEDVRRQQQTVALEDQMLMSARFEGIIGRSPRMWEMFSRIRRLAPHFRTVLNHGRNGNGKGLGLISPASSQSGPFRPFRSPKLFGCRRNAIRERTVRPRQRCLHWCHSGQNRSVRTRQ